MTNRLQPKHEYIHTPGAQPGDLTNAGRWQDMIHSPLGREALSVGLLEFVRRQRAATLQDATSNALELQGVNRYIDILLNLGEPDVTPGRGVEPKLQPV